MVAAVGGSAEKVMSVSCSAGVYVCVTGGDEEIAPPSTVNVGGRGSLRLRVGGGAAKG
jgi:hypothetical protein